MKTITKTHRRITPIENVNCTPNWATEEHYCRDDADCFAENFHELGMTDYSSHYKNRTDIA